MKSGPGVTVQSLGNRQNGQIGERLDNDPRHIGSAEACDFRGGFNIETVAIKGPEGNPENDTALISVESASACVYLTFT